jgi:PQQ-dependent catabolism-associated CXXCW motif protein
MDLTDARDTLGEPYPGLRSFRRDETHIFFGRERTITEMVDRLASHRFLAVTGLSGCGKSSLVRTGLLNALERGLLVEAGSDWRVADFRPGGRPLSRMVAALVDALGAKFSDNELGLIEAKLARGPLGLVGWLDEIEFSGETNLLLLVDQFEEIFRYRQGPSGDDINAFVALLLASAKQRKRRIYVVITMRSDFLGDCARFTDLAETINDGQFLTPQLTRDQCREAIEGPAAVYDGRVEPALITRMLNDMGGNPDQLPLMQHILVLLWHRARVRAGNHMPELSLADYDRLGGIGVPRPDSDVPIDIGANKPPLLTRSVAWVRRKFAAQPESLRTGSAAAEENRRSNGALSDHADRVLAKLTPAQQHLATILFQALTQGEGTGGRDVRRPARLAQIAAIAEAPIADLIPVIEVFRAPGRHFITPLVPDPLAPDTMIDISHESLIRQWAKLRQWVRDEYHSAEEYRDIERAAKQWKNGLGSLLMKLDLAVARKWRKTERPNAAWAERYGDAFSLAMTFLRKSERHRLWQRGIAAVSASAVIMVVLSTTMFAVYLMAVVTRGMSYVNPAGEWTDFLVDPQAALKRDVGTNTPLTIPGGRVIGTGELESALVRRTLEGVPFLAIDAWRRRDRKDTVPGSIYIEYAGDYGTGTFKDDQQKKLNDELAKLTNNNLNMPLVFFCAGAKCWESYNAALRAINLGYSKVYWYRGGVASWNAAQRQYPIDFSHIPRSFPGTIITGIRAIREAVWPNPDYFYKRGVDYAEKGQYDNAIDDFTKAIKLAPNNANAYLQRAQASASKEDYGQAISDFTKAAALDPTKSAGVQAILRNREYAAGYNTLGMAYYSNKDYDHAISDFDQAIKFDPNNATYHYSRGMAYYSNKDYDHAISDYDQAIKFDPNNATYHYNRGMAYYSNKDYDHAISDYDQAIKFDPNNATYHHNRGMAYHRSKDYDHALSDCDRAIKLDPNNADYYNERGLIYIAERDYDHAVQDFSKAITLQQADPIAYWHRGRAELYWDKLGAAADDLAVVVKLAPTNPYGVIWLHIARTRAGENDASEFANTQKLAQTIWPGPIIGLFLGSVTPDAVRTAAQATGDPTTRNDQLCEADFYIGIYQGAKGDQDGARQSFQSAENSCPHGFVEKEAAGFELTRLH